MANDEKNDSPVSPIDTGRDQGVLTDEKLAALVKGAHTEELHRLNSEEEAFESHLNVTEDDLIEAKAVAATLSLEGVRKHEDAIDTGRR
ncbi:hypothetical protein COL516b_012006 [Colletotrichum fioriniae]|nr:uncharacterized protein COL516b_012006 [Colletotrichum fioriniae]KAJ0296046.1 hypothetical protein COL516b_012006 [Colletotrichum fioriniae]